MCVPVRSSSSRSNSTSSMRGSTVAEYCLPFTFSLMATRWDSAIDVPPFDALALGPAMGDVDGAAGERGDHLPLGIGAAAHVGLGIGGGARRLGRRADRFVVDGLAAQRVLRLARPDGR